MPSTYYVAWWNLENLFDEEDPLAGRRSCSGRSAPTTSFSLLLLGSSVGSPPGH
jgi:hypothetical protein